MAMQQGRRHLMRGKGFILPKLSLSSRTKRAALQMRDLTPNAAFEVRSRIFGLRLVRDDRV